MSTPPKHVTIPEPLPGFAFPTPRIYGRGFASSAGAIDLLGGVEPETVAAVAAELKGKQDVTVRINSPGGDLFAGLAIYNALRAHPGKVTVQVLGVAASAAAVIAMAGSRIEIARSARIMIHRAWAGIQGNEGDLDRVADILRKLDASQVDIFMGRTGQPVAAIREMLDAETWLDANEAIRLKFADALLPETARAAAPVHVASKAALADLLQNAGLPKAAAARAAAGGFGALSTPPRDDARIVAAIRAATALIRKP